MTDDRCGNVYIHFGRACYFFNFFHQFLYSLVGYKSRRSLGANHLRQFLPWSAVAMKRTRSASSSSSDSDVENNAPAAVPVNQLEFQPADSQLGGSLQRRRLHMNQQYQDPTMFFQHLGPRLAGVVRESLQSMIGLKLQLRVKVRFSKPSSDGPRRFGDGYFNSRQRIILRRAPSLDQELEQVF